MVAMEMPHVSTPMEALIVYVMMDIMEMGSSVQVCYSVRERERGTERERERRRRKWRMERFIESTHICRY